MKNNRNRSMPIGLGILLVSLISACNYDTPEAPDCRVKVNTIDENKGNAGCVIPYDERIVTVTHIASGKLDIPGGTAEPNEYAQCTAHRETWEETGINVEVNQHLLTLDNGYHLYLCTSSEPFAYDQSPAAIPQWSQWEISSIQLIDLFASDKNQWRFPEELPILKDMLTQKINPTVNIE